MTGNPQLVELYKELHATEAYGNTSVKNLRFVRPEIRLLQPKSVLDYGCGQSKFLDRLDLGYPVDLVRYDPAIPEYQNKPDGPFDLLVNIDVLEHIEESDLDDVLAEMRSLCRDAIIIVDTKPASKVLADGRNAHVTLRPHQWWKEKIEKHFGPVYGIGTARRTRAGFKTWERSPGQLPKFLAMRVSESASYLAKRAVGRHK